MLSNDPNLRSERHVTMGYGDWRWRNGVPGHWISGVSLVRVNGYR
jgi:hypothetical protein